VPEVPPFACSTLIVAEEAIVVVVDSPTLLEMKGIQVYGYET
jgi:hypothetical protein